MLRTLNCITKSFNEMTIVLSLQLFQNFQDASVVSDLFSCIENDQLFNNQTGANPRVV